MKRKVAGYIILALVYFFPFRWAYTEFPNPVILNGRYVDAGGMHNMFYFLLVAAGMLLFFYLTNTNPPEKTKEIIMKDTHHEEHLKHAA